MFVLKCFPFGRRADMPEIPAREAREWESLQIRGQHGLYSELGGTRSETLSQNNSKVLPFKHTGR